MRCPVIVGRTAELEALVDAVAAAADGRGGVVFVAGEAGVGKSRLILAAADAARSRGMTVLRGRAVASGATLAYRPWAEALQSAVRDTDFEDVVALHPFRSALARLVPAWREADRTDVGESPLTLGEGTLRLLRAVGGRRGSVAILEDLHWADPDSLALLEYLADKLTGEPIVVLAACRPERGSAALRVASQLRARRDAELIELDRLDDEGVRAMTRACLGVSDPPPEVDELLSAYTDGLPIFVEELLASLVDRGALVRDQGRWQVHGTLRPSVPLTFTDSFHQRLSILPPEAARVLASAALLGRHFDWTLLAPACDLDEHRVLDILRGAAAAQLIEEDETAGRFRFRHALSRDAARDTLLSPERARLARQLLMAVLDEDPQLTGESCEVAAALAVQAGHRDQAAQLLLESARRAVDAGALATAITAAEQSVELSHDETGATSLEAAELLVSALALAGKPSRAEPVGLRLLTRLEQLQAAPARRARIHAELARSAAAATRWEQARRHVDAARHLAAASDDPALVAQLEVLHAQVALGEHRPEEAGRAAQTALRRARSAEMAVVVCEALEVLGRVARLTDWRAAEDWFIQALDTAERAQLPLWRIRALAELGIQDVFAAGPPTRLELARSLAEDAGALVHAAHADLHLAVLHHLHHEIPAGLAAVNRAEAAARRYRLGLLLPAVLANRALLETARGDEQAAEAATDEALALCAGDPQVEANIRGLPRTVLALIRGDRAQACRELEHAVEVMPPASDAASGPFADMLVLLRALDDDLTPEGREALAPPDRIRHRLGEGFFAAGEAVAAGRGGDPAAAVTCFARVDTALSAMPGFQRLVRLLTAEPALRDGWGEPVAWLRDAVAFCDTTGWDRLASLGRALLRQAGVTAPLRRSADAVAPHLAALGVTAREAEVLGLVEQGLPNRAIADRLVLSVRTVEKHVERLLAKTGTATRAQLAVLSVRLSEERT